MHLDYPSFDIVAKLESKKGLIESIKRDASINPLLMPFNEVESSLGDKLIQFKDITFLNTKEFSTVGNYYLKHGVYTHYDPIYDSEKYDSFWDAEEGKRKEGLTLPCSLVNKENGDWVLQDLHITGEHYGYLNFAPIKRVSEKTLREIERRVRYNEDISDIADKKETSLPQFFDSDYYYFKAIELAREKGKHLVVAKARRKGYSYKNGWVAANRADLYRGTVTGLGAFHADSLYPEGTMSMTNRYLQHIAKHTDWAKRRLINREDFIKFGYMLNDGLGVERGFLSRIFAESFAPNNPGALRGKDCDFMLVEEGGKNPILDKVLTSTLPTLKAGTIVTGLMVVFGTGGGEDKQWEAFEDLFYSPSADDFLAFDNIWDDDSRGLECGFFVPSYMGKEGFVDKHGNSNVKGAILYELEIREKKKRSRKANKLSDYVMEEPFTPKEAFSRAGTNIFPSAELEEQLKRVQKDPDISFRCRSGNLIRTSKGVIFKDKAFMTEDELKHYHPPVVNHPLKRHDDPHGCFVMVSPPFRDPKTGLVPNNLYRIWHDPFAINKDGDKITSKDSLGSFFVYEKTNNITKGQGDRLVAWFHGRPNTTDEINEIMFKAADLYSNGDTQIIQFENDRGNVKDYARRNQRLHQLADEPNMVWNKSLQVAKTGRLKGMTMNNNRKENGVIYLRDWLTMPRGFNDFSNKLLNLHYIYDELFLKQLLKYNLKGNFDTVSSALIGMFDTKEQVFVEIEKPRSVEMTSNNIFDRELF